MGKTQNICQSYVKICEYYSVYCISFAVGKSDAVVSGLQDGEATV